METLFLTISLITFISLLLYFIPRFCVPELDPPPLKRCATCHELAVEPAVIDYSFQALRDTGLKWYTVKGLKIPICRACGAKWFTIDVDNQMEAEIDRQKVKNVK